MVNMQEDCQFLKDLEAQDNPDGASRMALYNLAVSVGQVKLFSKGIKPNRHWRLKDVKYYFGLVGGTDKILSQLEQLQDIINAKETYSVKNNLNINLSNERS